MKKRNKFQQKKKINPWLFWSPRILTILFICFLALFSLDVFDGNSSLSQILLGLLMHNIPSLILLVVLIISWKYELFGAIAFALAGLFYILMIALPISINSFNIYNFIAILTISLPAFIIAILFYLNYLKKKK
ncbi:MAG: hypothetical protein WCX73_03305 [Candidatus Pacearchaeota archaeon]